MKIHWKFCISVLLATVFLPLLAEKAPQYKELRTPKPEDWHKCSTDEFKIDLSLIESRASSQFIYGDRNALLKFARFYQEDPEGVRQWKIKQTATARLMNSWYFPTGGFKRYIYKCSSLDHWSFIYALTGHKLLGRFIHDHVMQVAELPEDFWLHKELRKYKPERPLGMIETGQLAKSIAGTMSLAGDLFTPAETTKINDALRKKGIVPMLNFLQDSKMVNNYLAVVSSGTYLAGKYLNDPQVCATSKAALLRYVTGSVEKDGSYGEGFGYFGYPVGYVSYAVAAMSPEEQKSFMEQSGLRHSAEWLAYPYLYSTASEGKALHCVYADNSYSGTPSMVFLAMIADIYSDPVAEWLGRYFSTSGNLAWKYSNFAWGLSRLVGAEKTLPTLEKTLELPLIQKFDNGDNFFRSSWESDSIVLSLYTAGFTRTGYAHQRPERNSINLGAYGEYFIISPHSASYRSPIHYDYDCSTLSANTVRIDNGDQLMPYGKPSWGKNPSYANYGKPLAKLLRMETNPEFDSMTGDARKCYKENLSEMFRTVLYRRSENYFVVIDQVADSQAQKHSYTLLWHFNNRDEKLLISGEDSASMFLERPRANLAVFSDANCKTIRSITDGYMHGVRLDYSPGGKNEGKLGSAKVLNVSNVEPLVAVTFVTVLQPLRKDETAKPVSLNEGKLTVGDDVWTLNKKSISLKGHTASLGL